MDTNTKNAAKEKAEFMEAKVAYPDEILDVNKLEEQYRNFNMTLESYYQNLIDVFWFNTENYLKELRNPVDKKTDWKDHAHTSVEFEIYSYVKNSLSKFQELL